MQETRGLTDQELAEIRRRRPAVRAALAARGVIFTPAEERLFEQMDEERLTADARAARITKFLRARRIRRAIEATQQ